MRKHALQKNNRLIVNRVPSRMRSFLHSETGVVTVEWVAIAAGVTVGAIAITFIVMQGLVAPAQHIASQLTP